MVAPPPRPYLTEDEIRALSDQERAVAVAEWSSYNARLRREQDQRVTRGSYRGARARGRGGRGRGYYGGPSYQPYSRAHHTTTFQNRSTTFNPSNANRAAATFPTHRYHNGTTQTTNLSPEKQSPCPMFTSTGVCKRPRCPDIHDPDKTAICKSFLFKGICANGASCPLSHDPSAHRSPNCIHFQNDHCNKDDCHYAHVHVNVDAQICEAFARLGYCGKGDQCADRHAFECPDFTNQGTCEVQGCRLPHVVHAGRMRKARKTSSEVETPPESDSPVKEVVEANDIDESYALTQQADFIRFES